MNFLYSKKIGRFTTIFEKKLLNDIIHHKLGNGFLEIDSIDYYQKLLLNFTHENVDSFIRELEKYLEELKNILLKEIKEKEEKKEYTPIYVPPYLTQRHSSFEESPTMYENNHTGHLHNTVYKHKKKSNIRKNIVSGLHTTFYVEDEEDIYSPDNLNLTILTKLGNNNFLDINNIVDYQLLIKNFTRSNVNTFIKKFNDFVEKLKKILIEEIEKITVIKDVERNEKNRNYSLKGYPNESGTAIRFDNLVNPYQTMVVVPEYGYDNPFYMTTKVTKEKTENKDGKNQKSRKRKSRKRKSRKRISRKRK
uniref:Uncharacterized protein n=1 Tax=viral metagenome TaxID=1070528 RepID=A0A6C0DZS4_9ZZZZ